MFIALPSFVGRSKQETAVEGEQLLRTCLKLRERVCGFMSTWTGTGRLNLAYNLKIQVDDGFLRELIHWRG